MLREKMKHLVREITPQRSIHKDARWVFTYHLTFHGR